MPSTYKLSADQEEFKSLYGAMKLEGDGKLLKAEINAGLRVIMAPAVAEVKSSILGMESAGLSRGPDLRQAVAAGVKTGINASGRRTGVRVYVSKKGMPRRFSNAPRDLNAEGWEVRGRTQVGLPGFFDRPLAAAGVAAREVVLAAVRSMARRIASRH